MQSRSFNGWSWGDRNSSRSSLRCHCSPSSLDLLQVTITDMFFHRNVGGSFEILITTQSLPHCTYFEINVILHPLFKFDMKNWRFPKSVPKKSESSTSVKQFAFSISSFQETVCIRVQKLFWTQRADSEWSHNKLKLTTPYLRDWVTRPHEQRLASILPVGRSFSPVLFQRVKIIMMITSLLFKRSELIMMI